MTILRALFCCSLLLLLLPNDEGWASGICSTPLVEEASEVRIADLDGDGDLDLAVASLFGECAGWWENEDGLGTAWIEREIPFTFGSILELEVADLDGDGDPDLLVASDWPENEFIFLENLDGAGLSWSKNVIAPGDGARSITAADLDSDGDLDVAGGDIEGGVWWWENLAGDASSWTERSVASTGGRIDTLGAADLDGDGTLDLFGGDEADDRVLAWLNDTGDGSSWVALTIDSFFEGAQEVRAADLDADGDPDLFGAADATSDTLDLFSWWRNPGDTSDDWERQDLLSGSRLDANAMVAVDLDDDGDLDLVGVGTHFDTPVLWWENTFGDGSAWIERTIDEEYGDGWSVAAGDLDGDGEIDLAAASVDRGVVLWFSEDPLGGEWTTRDVTDLSTCFALELFHLGPGGDPIVSPANSIDCAPGEYVQQEIIALTATPDPDAFVRGWFGTDDDSSTSTQNQLEMPNADHEAGVLYTTACHPLTVGHTGDGSDPLAAPVGDGRLWVERIVVEELFAPDTLTSADLDGDGDTDLITESDGIQWLENLDGQGTHWASHFVLDSIGTDRNTEAADLDQDGDLDILHRSPFGVTWGENASGDASVWIEHPLADPAGSPADAKAADIDGDGDLDALVSIEFEGELAWWENVNGDATEWSKQLIDAAGSNWSLVAAVDIDGDGDIDAASVRTFSTDLVWWENLNRVGTAWSKHELGHDIDGNALAAADIDGDGDSDLTDGESWWENVDAGATWIAHAIGDGFRPVEASVADIDGDGDADVVTLHSSPSELVWFENLAGDGLTWQPHVLASGITMPEAATVGDLDGDGDPDVVASLVLDDEDVVAAWTNVLVSELGCASGFNSGDRIDLIAAPSPGSGVGGWMGTDDDDSTSTQNRTTMPNGPQEVSVEYLAGCFELTLSHTGLGDDPVASPTESAGCDPGFYVVGETIDLVALADPLPGWRVGSWTGTDNDGSDATTNRVTMPASDRAAAVHYLFDDTCFSLDLVHTGSGSDPTADPAGSLGCPAGEYLQKEIITLTAVPDPGWEISVWIGTDDDSLVTSTNLLTMPAEDHTSGVQFGIDQILVSGSCSLADAISAANTDSSVGGCAPGAGSDTIVLTQDVAITSELPVITSPIAILANGHTIRRAGSESFRVLQVGVAGELELDSAEIRDGSLGGDGAGILNHGVLTVTNSTISGNASLGTSDGGGLYNESSGIATLINTTISDNVADGGGGIANLGILDVIGSTISGNHSDTESYADARGGGGIHNWHGGVVTLVNSTVSNNVSTGDGFYGDGGGAGIRNRADGVVTLINTTMAGNYTPSIGGAIYNGYFNQLEYAKVTLVNSILVDSFGEENCAGDQIYIDGGGNFDDDGSCPGAQPITPGIDLDLDLAPNGGPTLTHALRPGSVAIDAAGACGLETDQRGFARNDGACDSGSFELGAGCFSLSLSHTGSGGDPIPALRADGTLWQGAPVATLFDGAFDVAAVDLDGDGDVDLVGAARTDNAIVWWENLDGQGGSWEGRTIATSFESARAVAIGDLDGDGDPDVAGAARFADQIAWWENLDGDGGLWAEHVVATGFDGARSVALRDIDGDGDTDIAGAAELAGTVSWWENLDGDGTAWIERVVDPAFAGAWAVAVGDLDGDGDPDLAGAADGAGSMVWWENLFGDGSGWATRSVDLDVPGARAVALSDLDSDGDLDLVGASSTDDLLLWWENLSGDGSSWVRHPVDASVDGAGAVAAADLDGDGDPDLIAAGTTGGTVGWWDNLSSDGTTWSETVVGAGLGQPRAVAAADLDGDGDLDLAGALEEDDEIRWWSSRTSTELGCSAGEVRSGDRVDLTAAPDPGWIVAGWSGTDDDASTALENTLTMPAAEHTSEVHYVEENGGLTLDLTGTCPGEVTIDVAGASPFASIVLAGATSEGSWIKPFPPCEGLELGLRSPRPLATLSADESGAASVQRELTAPQCATFLQAVETATCRTSGTAAVP